MPDVSTLGLETCVLDTRLRVWLDVLPRRSLGKGGSHGRHY